MTTHRTSSPALRRLVSTLVLAAAAAAASTLAPISPPGPGIQAPRTETSVEPPVEPPVENPAEPEPTIWWCGNL